VDVFRPFPQILPAPEKPRARVVTTRALDLYTPSDSNREPAD